MLDNTHQAYEETGIPMREISFGSYFIYTTHNRQSSRDLDCCHQNHRWILERREQVNA